MAEHYYTQEPTSKHEEHAFTLECAGRALRFETDAGVFSKLRLDPGTEHMEPQSGSAATTSPARFRAGTGWTRWKARSI